MTTQESLFNQKTIDRLCSEIQLSAKQKKAAIEWLQLLQEKN
ncbi:hypothetical protein BD31_I1565 [Candidatus Nitrosopumilus salaria BD31]|uniref:Uncharacterized protein n=1 Tax=Candidatus Nitrosopumilus salarius BD31 TaxID=859350 RepID=I3D1K8_9ARCH|nr:hypothetical protein BD31_I1565 [Candidatus Nitrosopumilus salaria BD31]